MMTIPNDWKLLVEREFDRKGKTLIARTYDTGDSYQTRPFDGEKPFPLLVISAPFVTLSDMAWFQGSKQPNAEEWTEFVIGRWQEWGKTSF
jgi:hypothetical protein